MPTYAEVSAKLLVDSAAFFRTLAEQNEPLKQQMTENADVFEQMAVLLNQAPEGELDGSPHKDLASQLLKDSANFFRTLAEQNEPLKEQMEENAEIFDEIAVRLAENPLGVME